MVHQSRLEYVTHAASHMQEASHSGVPPSCRNIPTCSNTMLGSLNPKPCSKTLGLHPPSCRPFAIFLHHVGHKVPPNTIRVSVCFWWNQDTVITCPYHVPLCFVHVCTCVGCRTHPQTLNPKPSTFVHVCTWVMHMHQCIWRVPHMSHSKKRNEQDSWASYMNPLTLNPPNPHIRAPKPHALEGVTV